jgi:hypothetical protein
MKTGGGKMSERDRKGIRLIGNRKSRLQNSGTALPSEATLAKGKTTCFLRSEIANY